MTVTEWVARAIAEADGCLYDHLPANKIEWLKRRGEYEGFNYKSDYLAMAEAAIDAYTKGVPA